MKFTIVTPSFNKGDYILKTIESVLKQRRDELEIEYFVMDNFSSDNTPKILEKFSQISEVNVFQQQDLGQFDAINQGWAKGTGEIFAWLNADDVYLETALWDVANFFKMNPDVMAIYGESVYLDVNDETLKSVTNIRDYSHHQLLSHDFITQPSTFIRRQVFEQIGPLSSEYRYIFDWDYWIRISQKYDFVRVPFLISGYRITGTNLTSTGKNKRLKEMIVLVWTYGGLVHLMYFVLRLLRKYLFGVAEIPNIEL